MFNESTDIDIASSIGEASRVEAANECLLDMAEEELEVERQARHAVEGEREVRETLLLEREVQAIRRGNQSMWSYRSLQCMVVIVSVWAQLLHYLDPEFGTSPCLYCDL